MNRFTVLFLGIAALQLTAAAEECTVEDFDKKFDVVGNKLWPNTKADLDPVCRGILPLLDDAIEYAKGCHEKEFTDMLPSLRTQKKVMNQLCTEDTELNNKFLNSVDCMQDLGAIGMMCYLVTEPTEFTVKDDCRDRFMSFGCINALIFQYCGEDALFVMKAQLALVAESEKNRYCGQEEDQKNFL